MRACRNCRASRCRRGCGASVRHRAVADRAHAGLPRAVASPDRVVFGSDWPFANAGVVAEAVKTYEAVTSISPAQRAAIDRSNALSLSRSFHERYACDENLIQGVSP